MNKKDACEILDLPLNYTPEQLKKQYHIKALRWHPDKNNDSKEATEQFQKITEAHKFLISSDNGYYDDSKNKYSYEYLFLESS